MRQLTPLVCLLVFGCGAIGAAAQTLEEQERSRALERGLSKLDHAMRVFEGATNERRAHCNAALADQRFCDCLAKNLPMIVSFQNYIEIIVRTKDELRYGSRSAEDKEIIDSTRQARDMCAKRAK